MISKHQFLTMLAVLVLFTLATPVASLQTTQAQAPAAWTFMVYVASDNDLEPFSLEDINELEAVGSSSDVSIVVQMDRAEGYATEDGDWTDARRFLITQDDNFESVTSEVVANLGETNHGDPANLVDFALWAMQTYPAERYGLIMWDHGGGWFGYGQDESAGGDGLTLGEIDSALDQITGASGSTFELIGFDACLMGQFEVARMLAPYAHYALLAQETEPGNGWFYSAFMPLLLENPAMNGAELGQRVVDSYMQFYSEIVTYYDQFDLNLSDLTQVGTVEAALGEFARAVQADPASVLSAIGDARNNAQTFGGATNPDEGDYFSSVDLIHFMELLQSFSTNADVNQAAQTVIDAVGQMMIYHQANRGLPGARGLSIYFPRNGRVYGDYGGMYPQEAGSDWLAFLETFYGVATETLPPAAEGVVTIRDVYPADVVSIHTPPVVMFDTNGQDIVNVSFAAILQLDDGTQITLDQASLESAEILESGEVVVDFPDGYSANEFTWGVEMPVVSDGVVAVPTLLLDNPNDPNAAAVSGTYISQSGPEVTAYLNFDLDTHTVSSVWGVSEGGTGAAPFEIKVQPGDLFVPTWRFYDADNEVQLVPAPTDPLTFGAEPFTFYYEPAASGTYEFIIVAEDLAGNIYADSTQITVDNEGLDTAYRGFTDVTFGINFLYPWEWLEPVSFQDEEGGTQLIISEPDENINIYVSAYDVTSSQEMLDIALAYAQNITDVEVFEPVESEIAGYAGHYIEYTFTLEGAPHQGIIVTTYVPDNAMGYMIDLDTVESMIEEATGVFDVMINSLNFFPPPASVTEGAESTPSTSDTMSAILGVFETIGYTEDELNAFLADFEITLEDIQAEIDGGELTLDDLREIAQGWYNGE